MYIYFDNIRAIETMFNKSIKVIEEFVFNVHFYKLLASFACFYKYSWGKIR